jgi:hypothetical protein
MNRHSDNATAKDWEAARLRLPPDELPFLERLMDMPRPSTCQRAAVTMGAMASGRACPNHPPQRSARGNTYSIPF